MMISGIKLNWRVGLSGKAVMDGGQEMTREEIENRIKAVHEDMRKAIFPSEHIAHAKELAKLHKLLDKYYPKELMETIMERTNLIITRKQGESFEIGSDVTVTVVKVKGRVVAISIRAPKEINIRRSEIEPQ